MTGKVETTDKLEKLKTYREKNKAGWNTNTGF